MFCRSVVAAMATRKEIGVPGQAAVPPDHRFRAIGGPTLARWGGAAAWLQFRIPSSIGERLMLKGYRRLRSGVIELEMGRT